MRLILTALIIFIAGVIVYTVLPMGTDTVNAEEGTPIVAVQIPSELGEIAMIGKRGFDTKCSSCHGENAVGKNGVAPPLIHKIYEPSHHGDESFQRAVAMGVRLIGLSSMFGHINSLHLYSPQNLNSYKCHEPQQHLFLIEPAVLPLSVPALYSLATEIGLNQRQLPVP